MTRRKAAAVCAFGLTGRSLRAQASDPRTTVTVDVMVRSATGEVVRNLGVDDFTLADSCQQQVIRSFSNEPAGPLTVGLLMDTNASPRRMPEAERRTASGFLQKMLRPQQDAAFVIQFGAYVELRQYLTGSPQSLESALQPVESKSLTAQSQRPSGSRLFDAVVLASQQCTRLRPGRKACIVLTNGIDSGSQSTVAEAIEAAQRADTQVNLILFSNLRSFAFPHPAAARMLRTLATETGGSYFQVSENQPIERIFGQIEQELRGSYRLGYTPAPGSGYRTIQVGVKRKGLVAQAREGYYASVTADVLPRPVRIVRVDPLIANAGDVVTTSGDALDPSNVIALFLTDGTRTLEAQTLEQTATTLRFKIPDQADPGPWVPGEKRPHFWSIVLRAPSGDLLQYVGFQIGIG